MDILSVNSTVCVWCAAIFSFVMMGNSFNLNSLKQVRFCALPNLLSNEGQFYLPHCSTNLTATFSVQINRQFIYGFQSRVEKRSCHMVQHLHFNHLDLGVGVAPDHNFLHLFTCLFFARLDIEVVQNYALENAPGLTEVSFRFNKIRHIMPHAFSNNSELRSLDLGDNRIVKLARNLFKFLSKLRILQLSNNQLININAVTFKSLRNLQVFHLANNTLQGQLESAPFFHLSNLKELSLKDNLISFISRAAFNGLTNLLRLNLRGNYLNVVDTGCFLNLTNLQQLDLGENAFLRLAPMRQFSSTGSITRLRLDGTPELIYDSAWLDDVPLDCSIYVSHYVYNCFLNIKKHPLRNYRYVYATSISNVLPVNKTCLYRVASPTSSKNLSTMIVAAAVGGLLGMTCLAMCVYVGYRQIMAHCCGTFKLQNSSVGHSSKSQLCTIDVNLSSCSINSIQEH